MNTHSSWDDAQIHAYVDGALDAPAAARLEADSRGNALLAARIARQRELRRQLRAAFDPVLDEPVPERLRAAIAAPSAAVVDRDVADLSQVRARRRVDPATRRWALPEWSAIAATLVFGTLLGSMLFRTPGGMPLETVQGRLVASGALDAALSTQASGAATQGADMRVGLSFRVADGSYCRTFSLRGGSGFACRRQDHWAVQMLEDSGTGPATTGGDFRQAASALSPAMLAAIGALGAGDALTPEQEQALLRSGWKTGAP
jgi:hypothetical protein